MLGLVAVTMFVLVSCSVEEPGEVPEFTSVAESAATTPLSQPPAPVPPAPAVNLVDPAAFAYSGGLGGSYFTTPSGFWRCAILPDAGDSGAYNRMAGCQPKSSMDMNVTGAPLVPDHSTGNPVASNSILVGPTDDARFASLSQALFWREDGATPVLAYGQTLSVSGFSCNVQESGVSCRSDGSLKGFQFSSGGYTFQYAEAIGLQTAAAVPSTGTEPVLGRIWGPDQQGYGEVRPIDVYNGGSLSGLIENIVWQDWGGAQAIGSGKSRNVDKSPSGVANAPIEPATIVGFDLGDCEGTLMYRSLVWFFPSNGQTFDSVKALSTNSCQERAYTEPGSVTMGGPSCGVVTAADGVAREVLVLKGNATCPEAMAMMNATYRVLYDKPLDGMDYGEWSCGIVPAGERLFTCTLPNLAGQVAIYRSLDDPYR